MRAIRDIVALLLLSLAVRVGTNGFRTRLIGFGDDVRDALLARSPDPDSRTAEEKLGQLAMLRWPARGYIPSRAEAKAVTVAVQTHRGRRPTLSPNETERVRAALIMAYDVYADTRSAHNAVRIASVTYSGGPIDEADIDFGAEMLLAAHRYRARKGTPA